MASELDEGLQEDDFEPEWPDQSFSPEELKQLGVEPVEDDTPPQ